MHRRVTIIDRRNRIINHQRYVQARSDDAIIDSWDDLIWPNAWGVCFSYPEWFVNNGAEIKLDAHACQVYEKIINSIFSQDLNLTYVV